MTDSERRNSWLRRDEMALIRNHCLRVIAHAEKCYRQFGNTSDGKRRQHLHQQLRPDICMRGLESQITGSQAARRRFAARQQVLCEQTIQYMDGYSDDEAIAAAYGNFTTESRREAKLTASRDREEIEKYISSSTTRL